MSAARFRPSWRALETRLGSTIAELWGSNEVRAVQPTVIDELQAGLIHFRSTIVQTIPLIYRDLEEAIEEAYPGAGMTVPSILDVRDVGRRRQGRQSERHARANARGAAESCATRRSTCSIPGCLSWPAVFRFRCTSQEKRRCSRKCSANTVRCFPRLATELPTQRRRAIPASGHVDARASPGRPARSVTRIRARVGAAGGLADGC